jgi:hypothetical protein
VASNFASFVQTRDRTNVASVRPTPKEQDLIQIFSATGFNQIKILYSHALLKARGFSMSDSGAEKPISVSAVIAIAAAIAAIIVLALAFTLYSALCPCERTPGGFLFGTIATEPVNDWGFANSEPLCQLQIYAGIRPHSINLNCMSTPQGELFLSCSVCTQKYWAKQVQANEPARLRLNGIVYPVILNRETDPAQMDAAWNSRIVKLQTFGGGAINPTPDLTAPRPEHWWTFHVASAT